MRLAGGASPAPVLERLRQLLRNALAPFPQLVCLRLLPLPGFDGVMLEAASLLRMGDHVSVAVRGRDFGAPELRRRLEGSLPTSVPAHYDVMLSYRWNEYDSSFSERLFDILSSYDVQGRPLGVFLDRKRLQDGHNFQDAFLRGLANSSVVVLYYVILCYTMLCYAMPCNARACQLERRGAL